MINPKGISLIQVLLAVFILAIITLSLYSLVNFTLKIIWESKAKITATQLANQKIEMARNLSYQNVGTLSGIPNGIIPDTEVITRNGINFTVDTEVVYIDDPFDGILSGDPNDTLNTDYKRMRIEVSWDYRYQHQPIVLITDIAPPGLESNVGGGTLKILVYDANGIPVPQANVTIDNTLVSPAVHISTQTDNQGYLILPGAAPSVEAYKIMVAKEDYSTDQTYDTSPQLPAPEKPHASVLEGQTTNISFAIDLLADLNISVQNENGLGLADITLNMRGGKIIGLDAEEKPVYKYNQNHTTNSLGQINLTNIEWDSYTFTLPTGSVYNISTTEPIQPLNLLPHTTANIIITVVPQANHSTLVIVEDINGQPLEAVEVHFFSLNPPLDQTITTTNSGQAYFTPWIEATSTLEISKLGYENYYDTFAVSGYHIEEVTLIAD